MATPQAVAVVGEWEPQWEPQTWWWRDTYRTHTALPLMVALPAVCRGAPGRCCAHNRRPGGLAAPAPPWRARRPSWLGYQRRRGRPGRHCYRTPRPRAPAGGDIAKGVQKDQGCRGESVGVQGGLERCVSQGFVSSATSLHSRESSGQSPAVRRHHGGERSCGGQCHVRCFPGRGPGGKGPDESASEPGS